MLEVRHLKKEYKTKKGAVTKALDDVSLTFPETGMVFILGKSGSGKSTLLNVCGGLDRMDEGEIIIKGKSSKDFSTQDFDSYRNTYVGFVFQEYNILDEFTVEQNIALALELQNKKPDKEVIAKLLEDVDLTDFATRKPNTLSGGQKQRVAIARALVKEPEIIMADEPTGALDSKTGQQVFDTLKKLSQTKLVLIVSHDRDFAEQYGDRIIELKDGQVLSDQLRSEAEGEQNVKFYGTDTVCVSSGSNLTDADMQSIKNFLARSGGTAVISTSREKIAQFREDRPEISVGTFENIKEQPTSKQYEPQKLIRSHMPLKHAIKMGASSLKTKPVRLAFTIFLSVMAFVLFGLASTLMLFDGKAVTKATLNEIGDKHIIFSKAYYETYRSYEGSKLTYEEVYKRGTGFTLEEYEELKKKYPGAIAAVYININIDNNVKINQAAAQFYSTNLDGVLIADDSLTYVSGTAPKEIDEVAISDFILSMIMLKSTEFYYYPEAVDAYQEGTKLVVTNAEDIIFDEKNPRYIYVEGGYYKVTGVYKGDEIPSAFQSLKSAADQDKSYSGNRSDTYDWQDLRSDGMYNKIAVTVELAKKMAQSASSGNSYFDSSKYFKYSQSEVRIGAAVDNNEFIGYYNNNLGKYNSGDKDVLKLYGLDGKEVTSLGAGQVAMRYSDVANMLYNIYQKYNNSMPPEFWDNLNTAVSNAHEDYYANNPYPSKNSNNPWFDRARYNEYWEPAWEVINAAYNAALEEYDREHPEPKEEDFPDTEEYDKQRETWMRNRSNYANRARDKAEEKYRAEHPGGDDDEYVDFDIYSVVYRQWQDGYDEAMDQARVDAAGKLKPYYALAAQLKKAAREAFDAANPEPKHIGSRDWEDWSNRRYTAVSYSEPDTMLNNLAYDYVKYEPEEVFEIINNAFDMLKEMNAIDKIIAASAFDNSKVTVEIAGVYFEGSYGNGIYLSDDLYDKFFVANGSSGYSTTETKYEAPKDAYISSVFIPKTDSAVNDLVDKTYMRGKDDSTYMIRNTAMSTLNMAIELVDTLSLAFLIAGLVLALFAFLLMFNFISASISAKKKEIGILRAIGARTTDVFKIFVSEALIIAAICFVVSTLITLALCLTLNGLLLDSAIQISMFVFGPISVLSIFGIALLTAIISTVIPVGIYSRKPPIASIRAL